MGNTVVHIVTINQAKYGWSKYGGGNHGLVKDQNDYWYCQCCRVKCTKEMPAYMYAFDNSNREFVRLCSVCSHLAKVADIHSYTDLILAVRKLD